MILQNIDTSSIKRAKRSIGAVTLMVIYLMVSLSPLTSLVMHSKTVAHALTGECTGDCSTCGCSMESMATRTCCCAIKQKQQLVHNDLHDATPDSCKKTPDREQFVIVSCGCGSGNGKHTALPISETSELLPCYFSAQFSIPGSDTRFPLLTRRVTSFQDEPPVPPPKISIHS